MKNWHDIRFHRPKGQLVKNKNHTRDRTKNIAVLTEEVVSMFPDGLAVKTFLEGIKTDKPRYIRDQLQLIKETIKEECPGVINKALDFCTKNNLYSAIDFKDAIAHYSKEKQYQAPQKESFKKSFTVIPVSPDSLERIKAKPQIRDIKEYADIFKNR